MQTITMRADACQYAGPRSSQIHTHYYTVRSFTIKAVTTWVHCGIELCGEHCVQQRLKGTSYIIDASQTSENNCTAYVRCQNNWTCAPTFAFFCFFFAYPVDSYVREALQDIAGCTLQSWGHMTLHLDSHMAAHSRARKSLDRILQWDTQMHKRLRWCAVSNQISWIPLSSRSLILKEHRQPPKLFFFYTLLY